MKNRNIFCVLLLFSVWAYMALNVYLNNLTEYVVDERGFVHYGRMFFNLFFLDMDFFSDTWLKSLNCFGANNPKAGLFILGAIAEFWGFVATNINFENINEIMAQRYINAVFSASIVLFSFVFVALFAKGLPRIAVVALLMINPIFRGVSLALLPEVHMLFFIMLSLVILGEIGGDLGNTSYAKLFLLSLFMGLSVSSRLYGFCIYLTFLLVCISAFRKDIFLKFVFVSVFFGLVFYITNPSLYGSVFPGLEAMTVTHINVLGYKPLTFKFLELKYLFTYPYLIFRQDAFSIASMHSYNNAIAGYEYLLVVAGYFLAVRGLFYCISSKKYLPVFWFLSSHLWLVYPFLVLGSAALGPKTLLLPAMSVIFLSSFAFIKKTP